MSDLFKTSEVSEVSRKLGKISEVMADGYHFVKMRGLIELWQKQADEGDPLAQDAMKMINQFHKLCTVVESM